MDVQQILYSTFFVNAAKEFRKIRENGTRFVHYTSAESALKILNSGDIWLRNTPVMNDSTEMSHGLETLLQSIAEYPALKSALNDIHPGMFDRVMTRFLGCKDDLLKNTFIFCISEHGDPSDPAYEDRFGRLSMWRAYAKNTGVALVLKNTVFTSPETSLGVFTSPVMYGEKSKVIEQLELITKNILGISAILKNTAENELINYINFVLNWAVIGIKHPGFKEEREWRVVSNPLLKELSGVVPKTSIETIAGIPQRVVKVGINNSNIEGLGFSALLDRIIIGPMQSPHVTVDAFAMALKEKGVDKPYERICVSEIPLRW